MQVSHMGLKQTSDQHQLQTQYQSGPKQPQQSPDKNNNNNKNSNIYMVIYTKELGESFKNVCGKAGVEVHFKGGNTIRNLLVAPKDRDKITQKSGVIYRLMCTHAGCEEEYIGELARTFGEKGSRNMSGPLPPMTMATSQVIISVWTISPWWVVRCTVLPGPSRRPCIWGSMIHP